MYEISFYTCLTGTLQTLIFFLVFFKSLSSDIEIVLVRNFNWCDSTLKTIIMFNTNNYVVYK